MTWKYRGHLAVAGCFLVHFSLGALYSDGNFGPYLVSLMRYNQQPDPKTTSTYVVWIQAVQTSAQALLMFPAGHLERKFGCRLVAMVGCFIMCASTAVSYWTCNTTVAGITMTFGVLYGIGTGIAYVTALLGGMKWFPERQGMINGLIVAGFGLGASVIDPVQTQYINPNNYSPDEHGYFEQPDLLAKVPLCFLVMAGMYAGMQLVGCILMAPAPKNLIHQQEELEKAKEVVEETEGAPEGFSPRKIVHVKEFYFLWSTLFLNGIIKTFYSSMYKVFGQTFIVDDHFFAIIGSFTSVANALSRVCWGLVIDKITYRTTMTLISGSVAILLFTMPITEHGGKAMYGIWTIAMYLAMGGTFAVCPAASSRTFGPKHMTANYALIMTNNLIGPIVTAAITDPLVESLGYDGMFLFLGGLMCITMTITYFYNERLYTKSVEEFNAKHKNKSLDVIQTLSKECEADRKLKEASEASPPSYSSALHANNEELL